MGARTRIALLVVIVGALVSPAAARPQPACRLARIDMPACAGGAASASAPFCFGTGCSGGGVVLGFGPPDAPFTVTGLHVDGLLGSRAVGADDFPIILLPGETVAAELSVVLGAPGQVASQLVWYVGGVAAGKDGPGKHDDDLVVSADKTPASSECIAAVVASAPQCGGGSDGACVAESCVAGACVAAPADGAPCGDRCRTGGTCAGGACVGGTQVDCTDAQACTADACDPAVGCVHTPADAACDDRDPCTTDTCDPARGCVHTVRGSGPCDDGDPCTTGDRCRPGGCAGEPKRCSDPFACTDDRCVAGRCESTPVDSRCDAGACTQASCRPGDPGADRRGCVAVPVDEGEPCTDDGVACTDDVCTDGGCLHVPVDTRCGDATQCTAMACAPERADADTTGCAPTSERLEGDPCNEDGDPCSEDTCRDRTCRHDAIPEWQTCSPVQAAFRKSLALVSLTRGLRAAVAATPATAGARVGIGGMLTPLARVEADLDAAVGMLAGHGVESATVEGVVETPAQARARMALERLLRTPAAVRAFLAMARTRPGRATLGVDGQRTARTRGAVLLRGTKSLKAELRRLQQVSGTFAR